jgi:hypothetical protein
LAQVHLCQGNWTEAQTCLSRSQSLLGEIRSEEHLPEVQVAETQLSLARLALESHSMDEARTYLAQAVQTFEKLGAQAYLAEAREMERQ